MMVALENEHQKMMLWKKNTSLISPHLWHTLALHRRSLCAPCQLQSWFLTSLIGFVLWLRGPKVISIAQWKLWSHWAFSFVAFEFWHLHTIRFWTHWRSSLFMLVGKYLDTARELEEEASLDTFDTLCQKSNPERNIFAKKTPDFSIKFLAFFRFSLGAFLIFWSLLAQCSMVGSSF